MGGAILRITTGVQHRLLVMQPFDVSIRDETIKLGQFIKLANLVETGGQAKDAIADGQVTVNGVVDTRRGKTLREGGCGGVRWSICSGGVCHCRGVGLF